MLANVGIKTYMVLKLLRNPKIKTYIENVVENLKKPYIKSYIDQKEVFRGGYNLSIMLFGLHTVTVHIFSCESNNVGKCRNKILYK